MRGVLDVGDEDEAGVGAGVGQAKEGGGHFLGDEKVG